MDENQVIDNEKECNKFSFKELIKKWWFWVIIGIIVVVIIVIVCVSVNANKGNIDNDDSNDNSVIIQQQNDGKDITAPLVCPENEEYINNVENKPQSDNQTLALNYALQYSKYSGLSYNAIVNQLKNDGFSDEDAIYAADNCGADWNNNAIKLAQRFVEYEPYSKLVLLETLQAEGFSLEQAKYGVDNSGIDFVQQAKNSALIYLKVENYDKDTIVDRLVNGEGFTQEEANKGADLALAK